MAFFGQIWPNIWPFVEPEDQPDDWDEGGRCSSLPPLVGMRGTTCKRPVPVLEVDMGVFDVVLPVLLDRSVRYASMGIATSLGGRPGPVQT